MKEIFSEILKEGQAYSTLEIIAVLTALLYIFLAAKENRWCFVFGLISSLIYIYLATKLNYYFDSLINAYYVIMSFYGWFAWKKNSEEDTTIKELQKNKLFGIIGLGLLISLVAGFLAMRYSDASLAYLDAFTTLFSFIATWLVVKKYIENWLIWIAVDSIGVFMYGYKGFMLTAFLFLVYTIISIKAYFNWKKQLAHA